jgi:predicted ArsR family transcriptional regulator
MPVDSIANQSRLAVARRLGEVPSASATELAEATGLHLNTVRSHLQALEAHGAAERVAESGGRPGRPVVRYRLRRGFVPAGDELLPLSALLAAALAGLGPGPDRVREVGLDWGRRWSREAGSDDPAQRLRVALERLGFAVELDADGLRLGACPCPLVAPERPGMICDLADAVIDGVLEGTPRRGGRRRHDPKARRCSAAISSA